MSDSSLNRFVASVADSTERLAFVPSPPTPASGPDSGYFLLQRDDNSSWSWDADSSTWVAVASAGGAVPATVQGDVLYASGTNTLAALAKNASATRYLSNTGTTNNPAWAQVALATGVSGVLPVANGGTGSATGASIIAVTVALTDAEIKALPTTPKTLVAAAGANTVLRPIYVFLNADFSAGAYTNVNTTYAAVNVVTNTQWATCPVLNDSTTTPATTQATSFFGATDKIFEMPIPFMKVRGGWVIGHTTFSTAADSGNQPLQLFMDNNSSGVLTGGNAANTLNVTMLYTVFAV